MSKGKTQAIAVHIDELVLPHGSRRPSQAAMARMVEAEIERRFGGATNRNGSAPEPAPNSQARDAVTSVSDVVQQRIK